MVSYFLRLNRREGEWPGSGTGTIFKQIAAIACGMERP
jgi:hypothetical protein